MNNSPPQPKARLMKYNAIRLNVVNPRSISFYAEVKVTRGHILKILGPDLIN